MLPKSLRWQLSLLFLAVLFASLVAYGVTIGRTVGRLVREYQSASFAREAEVAAQGLPRELLAPGEGARLASWLEEAYGSAPYLSVVVFTEEGRVLAELRHPDWVPEPGPGTAELLRRAAGQKRVVFPPMARYPIALRPLEGSAPRAWVAVTFEKSRRALIAERAPGLWIVPPMILFVAAGAAGLLGLRLITRRLAALHRGIVELEAGKLAHRVEPGAEDEIGALSRAFNSMAGRLEGAVRELEAQDRARRELLADVSHELNTPLTTLRGNLELLAEEASDPAAVARFSAALADDVRVLETRVRDLLTVARDESARLVLAPARFDLRELVRETAAHHAGLFAARGLALAVDAPPGDAPVEVEADRARLGQVLANLVGNALAQLAAPGSVRLVVAAVTDPAAPRVLAVVDDGPGIPADELPHLFERFRRGKGAKGAGTGLGLAIAKRLVELHGGTIEVASEPGKGCRFTLRLPAPAAPEPGR